MELLAGAKTRQRENSLSQLANSLPLVGINPTLDYPAAAGLFTIALRHGYPNISLHDCLIATIAIRADVFKSNSMFCFSKSQTRYTHDKSYLSYTVQELAQIQFLHIVRRASCRVSRN